MPADVRVVRFGAVVSQNLKGFLPVLIVAVYSLAVPPQAIFGSSALEHLKDGFALGLALAGLTLRAIVIGSCANGLPADLRRATDLRTGGVYELCRNPLYLGSLIICFSIFLMHGSLHVVLMGTVGCIVLFGLMVRAEEHSLLEHFGDSYRAYCAATARWFPRLSRMSHAVSGMTFNVRRALRADWPLFVGTMGALWLTEYFEYLPDPLAARSQVYLQGLGLVGVGCAILALLVQISWQSGADQSAGREGLGALALRKEPATLGIRVDGRVRSVDVLENLLSLGQQEAILDATLEAADLRRGDRLVDVGCGSGKLAVAAAARVGAHGAGSHVLGIDATPGMIDLAVQRARRAGVAAEFRVGVAETLPLADGSADAVTSSYFFHHLPPHVKPRALREMWRVLAPGGRLVVTDYGRARGLLGLVASMPMRANFYEYVRPQLAGELEDIVAAERLGHPEIVRRYLGYITVMRLRKPV